MKITIIKWPLAILTGCILYVIVSQHFYGSPGSQSNPHPFGSAQIIDITPDVKPEIKEELADYDYNVDLTWTIRLTIDCPLMEEETLRIARDTAISVENETSMAIVPFEAFCEKGPAVPLAWLEFKLIGSSGRVYPVVKRVAPQVIQKGSKVNGVLLFQPDANDAPWMVCAAWPKRDPVFFGQR